MISEHSFAGAFRDILGEFRKALGAENLPGRNTRSLKTKLNKQNKDLLFPYKDSFKGVDLITVTGGGGSAPVFFCQENTTIIFFDPSKDES